MKYNISNKKLQDAKYKKWDKNKIDNLEVSKVFDYIDKKKALLLSQCAEFIIFKRIALMELVLHKVFFCKNRLCPICAVRRAIKLFVQLNKIVDDLVGQGYRFLFLTLTIRNCFGEDLIDTMDLMFDGFKKLNKYKNFKNAFNGYYRAFELNFNLEENTYHPHFHVILPVKDNYFVNPDKYIRQEEFINMWKKACNLDYKPSVHIQTFKGDTKKGVLESVKYTAKQSDFIIQGDLKKSIEVVGVYDKALKGRRLFTFGGTMKASHKKLNLDDPIDGNLINVNDEITDEELDYILEIYKFDRKRKNYFMIER